MNYLTLLQTFKKEHTCPFCTIKQEVILENKRAFMTLAISPYHEHHLLIIPKRHITSEEDLPLRVNHDMDELEQKGLELLHHMGHDNVIIMTKDGPAAGKSVDHLHRHLIPDVLLEAVTSATPQTSRTTLSKQEQRNTISELRKHL